MAGSDFAFLDSGIGGIPYMLDLKEKKPSARCVYLGDTAHFPYGEKSAEEVTRCAADTIRLIIQKWQPKTIVIACNTMSVTSLDDLRALFPQTPIVGTVPAIKLAASVTKNKKIGLLATNATVRHPYCARLVKDFAQDCQVFSRGDPDLIAFIEHDLFTSTEAEKRAAVQPAVDFFAANGCDTIILGCTHFTHIAKEFAAVAGSAVRVVDSREGVANQAIRVEAKKNTEAESQSKIILPADSVHPTESYDTPADQTFFVTACTPADETEYSTLCKGYKIPWGGKILTSE
ncbi:MAG: glutamate racemase [Treponema sp.]|nr:glutamate racemase [Treponema sp.]